MFIISDKLSQNRHSIDNKKYGVTTLLKPVVFLAISSLATNTIAGICYTDSTVMAEPCTESSTDLCKIEFTENVSGIPEYLREHFDYHDNLTQPITVPRIALVHPDNGTHENPPVLFVNGGHGSTSISNYHSAPFHDHWSEAIIVYTEASCLLGHNGKWKPNDPTGSNWPGLLNDPDWSPRYPYTEASSDYSDLNYLQTVINTVRTMFPHNESRAFAAGYSSGGHFTLSLTEFMPDTFRAFAVTGARARFGFQSNLSQQEIEQLGRKTPSRPIFYSMADDDHVFQWSPDSSSFVHRAIRQLTTRNGATVPQDADYLQELVDEVNTDDTVSIAYKMFKPTGNLPRPTAEVLLGVFNANHSWPTYVEIAMVDFFKKHMFDTATSILPDEHIIDHIACPINVHCPTYLYNQQEYIQRIEIKNPREYIQRVEIDDPVEVIQPMDIRQRTFVH